MSLVILLVIIFLFFLGNSAFFTKITGSRLMNTKVFTGYVVILLCTSLLSFFVPKGEFFPGEHLTDEEISANERLNRDIYTTVELGKIDEAEGLTKKESWELPLAGQILNIEATNIHAMVFIEKVKSLEDVVEVTHYSTYSYIDNIDITDRFTSPDIHLSGTTLKAFPPDPVNLKLVKFTNAFPFNQFSENGDQFYGGYGMMQGVEFLYIRVPAGTEISGDGYVIN